MSAPAEGKYLKAMEARFDTIGWGLLFLLVAALALPHGPAEFASACAVGIAMLALNLARIAFGVPVRWFGAVLGASMALAGGAALAGVRMDVFVVFFVLAGTVNVAAGLIRRDRPQTA